ncbi:MAG: hypothetical protein N0C82_20420 [Candidatus Thiodiazotropha endolucinida]|nr:hypothetical protein [Candidatus Thiodiazotropha taylori]MCW4297670.1 hypothetical protein [Candidatus Thiodiazotropha endolucinida]
MNWRKVDIDLYKAKVDEGIDNLVDKTGFLHCTGEKDTSDIVEKLNTVLNDAVTFSSKQKSQKRRN